MSLEAPDISRLFKIQVQPFLKFFSCRRTEYIEKNISWSWNQTTLRLAVKHHKYGSSELIQTLNEHGIAATYDEVLRFHNSVAKSVLDN